jgi:glyoxylase-like metal-dependent hydrolase (beta-lactamase superfamily II)
MTRIILTAIVISLTATGLQAQDTDEPAVEVIQLTDNIHVLMGMGGNIGVLSGEDGVFMIDDDMPPMAEKIDAAVRTIRDEPVRMLFNTHWHFDHAGGNEHFGKQGTVIVAHDNVRERLSTPQFSALTNGVSPPSPDAAIPVVTFDNTITFHLNGATVRAEHVPLGHTDGDAVLFFEEANVVHMGDLFFNKMYPVIDISASGSARGMIRAIDIVLPKLDEETVIIPGHGPVAGITELKEFRTMLETVTNRVQMLQAEGKTADEVVARKPSINFDEEWAWQFMPPERFVRMVYDSLKNTPPEVLESTSGS